MPAYILCIALAWMPFANGIFTLKLFDVTWTLYIAAIIFLFPFCFFRYIGSRYSQITHLQDAFIVLFTIQLGIFLFITTNITSAAYKYVYGILMPASLYFVVKGAINTEKQYLHIVKSISFGILLFSLVYIPTFFINGFSSRVVVFERDSIAAAIFFSFTLLFFLLTPLGGRLKIPATGISSVALLATLSRGLILCGLITPIISFLTKRGMIRPAFIGMTIFSLLITLFLTYNSELLRPDHWDPQLENSIERLTNIDYWKNGIYGRLETFKPAVKAFDKSPFYGNGFPDYIGGSTIHNFHLEWLQYGGIVGYTLICGVFFIHISRVSRFAHDRYIAAGCIFLLYMLINGLTNGLMHGVAPDMVFLTMALNDVRLSILKRQLAVRRAS